MTIESLLKDKILPIKITCKTLKGTYLEVTHTNGEYCLGTYEDGRKCSQNLSDAGWSLFFREPCEHEPAFDNRYKLCGMWIDLVYRNEKHKYDLKTFCEKCGTRLRASWQNDDEEKSHE